MDMDEARALAASSLYERGARREASLGATVDNPSFDASPALAPLMRSGASVDAALYTHQRTLDVAPSSDGLVRFTLEPEDLAVTRGDLADVRVVDEKGNQWPYLVERDAEMAGTEARSATADLKPSAQACYRSAR